MIAPLLDSADGVHLLSGVCSRYCPDAVCTLMPMLVGSPKFQPSVETRENTVQAAGPHNSYVMKKWLFGNLLTVTMPGRSAWIVLRTVSVLFCQLVPLYVRICASFWLQHGSVSSDQNITSAPSLATSNSGSHRPCGPLVSPPITGML